MPEPIRIPLTAKQRAAFVAFAQDAQRVDRERNLYARSIVDGREDLPDNALSWASTLTDDAIVLTPPSEDS